MVKTPWSLRRQFAVTHFILVATTATVVALIACLILRQYNVTMFSVIDERRTQSFSEVCDQALAQDNPALISVYMKLLQESGDVGFAYFADTHHMIRTHTDETFQGRSKEAWDRTVDPRVYIVSSSPVTHGGSVVIGFRRTFRNNVLHQSLRKIIFGIILAALIAMGLGFSLSLILASRLTRPIQDLGRSARAIGKGKFETRVGRASIFEVQELADVFNKMAEGLGELDRIKDDILSMVTHDLRTPLAAITSVVDLLQEGARGPMNTVQKEYLGIIRENAFALLRYVNDMLDMAKIKAGKMDYHLGNISIEEAVDKTMTLFNTLAEQKGVRLEKRMIELATVHADAEKLDHILANLMSNAIKHAPAETGRVEVEGVRKKNYYEVRVTDNGPGISGKGMPDIFQKFVTLTPTAASGPLGSGIGLFIVKTFVSAQGGEVQIESTLGKGSVFSFTLPVALGGQG